MLRNPACLEPLPDNLFYPPKRGDYVYFEAPPRVPGGPFLIEAAWAADASMLAYARYGATRMQPDEFTAILNQAGFPVVETIGECFVDNVATARGFFAANDTAALLAFRGTEKDDLNDLAADADAFLVDDGSGGHVHQGFNRYLQPVWGRVAQVVAAYRSNHPNQDICITGHSLGAALACLAFTRLQDPATSLFTFGCPRVGDQGFCNRIDHAARTQSCYRVVDNLDVVTHVPLHSLLADYEHPSVTLLWIDPTGVVAVNPPNPPSDTTVIAQLPLGFVNIHFLDLLPVPLPRPLADHSPVRYCHWIGQAAAKP